MAIGARFSVVHPQLSRRVSLKHSALQRNASGHGLHPRRCNRTGDLRTAASEAASASTFEIDRGYICLQIIEG